jgi:hypothetical protein
MIFLAVMDNQCNTKARKRAMEWKQGTIWVGTGG